MIQWQKRGLVFSPDQRTEWMHSHAQVPVADHLYDDVYRIYFAGRTRKQRSHIGFVELSLSDPGALLRVSEQPALAPGPLGCFDEHGVYPSSIVNFDGKKYLYYIGWVQGCKQPMFYANIGLAVSEDGGETFVRDSPAPLLGRSRFDPCIVTAPHVLLDGDLWRLTYVSGIRWEEQDGQLKSYYHIKYAESDDGLTWRRNGRIAIDFAAPAETNIARSWVLNDERRYRMWYSHVVGETPYRLGYAESADYLSWERKDAEVGITVSESGFDSEMICYANVIRHGDDLYMFYNGNSFGRDGFGLAIAPGAG